MNAAHRDELIKTLKARFAKNMRRHAEIDWGALPMGLAAHVGRVFGAIA